MSMEKLGHVKQDTVAEEISVHAFLLSSLPSDDCLSLPSATVCLHPDLRSWERKYDSTNWPYRPTESHLNWAKRQEPPSAHRRVRHMQPNTTQCHYHCSLI